MTLRGAIVSLALVAAAAGRLAAIPCTPGTQALCLHGGRFGVTVTWRTAEGASGAGTTVPVADDSGLFWFFSPNNIEMLIKVLDGCLVNDRFWVFAAATTNVELTLTVTDTVDGASRTYHNPLGTPAPPIQDTSAFASCGTGSGDRGEVALGGFAVDATGADPQALNAVVDLGISHLRATPNLGWYGNQPTVAGPYSWQVDPNGNTPDAMERQIEARGLSQARVLNSTRPEDPGRPAGAGTGDMFLLSVALQDDYQSFVRATVERYDGDGIADMPNLSHPIHRWSYTPEAGTAFLPQGDAAGFVQMFNLTAQAVKEADPSAEVILPLTTQGVYIAAFVEGFLSRNTITVNGHTYTSSEARSSLAGNVQYTEALLSGCNADLYDLHLYGDADSIPGRVSWLRSFLAGHGRADKPIVSYEGGEPYSGLGESFPAGPTTCGGGAVENAQRLQFQAGALVRHLTLALLSGISPVTFNLGSEYGDFGSSFGDLDLWTACRSPRPAYYTLSLAREKITPFRSSEELPQSGNARLFHFTFAPPKGDVWVAWDASGATGANDLSSALSFATAKVTHLVTIAGQSSATVTSEPVGALVLGPVPVFLERPLR